MVATVYEHQKGGFYEEKSSGDALRDQAAGNRSADMTLRSSSATRDMTRSQSMSDASVVAVVAKAKRAAKSLWMIIHAQVRILQGLTYSRLYHICSFP